jgi:uncharacterized protein
MLSRRFLIGLAAAIPGVGLLTSARAARAAEQGKQRVAYHVTEREKVDFVLGNIRNHIVGVGGPDKVEIILVAHGPALKAVQALEGDAATIDKLQSLIKEGVAFNVCGNTLKTLKYELSEFPAGSVRVDQGGVVRLAELQQQGYIYLRP